ncbi:MAG: hypothetical protein CL472_04435 [Acidobacteria bacterium]|nr:hypothetical protein [Acidobacteriota bacterium]
MMKRHEAVTFDLLPLATQCAVQQYMMVDGCRPDFTRELRFIIGEMSATDMISRCWNAPSRPHTRENSISYRSIQVALRKLLNDLDRLIESSEEDSTALSISRFKHMLIWAVHEADFDKDLADELDKIALVHIPNYTKSFLSAVKLGRDDDLETKLRETIDMMSTKIEDIVAEQRSRYRDDFNVQNSFLRNRNNPI